MPDDLNKALRDWHRRCRLVDKSPAQLRGDDVNDLLITLVADAGQRLELSIVGRSYEGRPIRLASIGKGSKQVLLWSQMHGDESTHTAVLLDLLNGLIRHADSVDIADKLLSECRLHMVPILNPDGAERQTRRNAQGIDLNRDARDLATPEGRVLADLVKRIQPAFGFNLHNQSTRHTVAGTKKVAVASVMAPPLPPGEAETPTLIAAQQVATIMAHAIDEIHAGHVGRYNADYMSRAFGEWVQSQGVATMLLEAGGVVSPDDDIVAIHFITLLRALEAIVTQSFHRIAPQAYFDIPLNGEYQRFDVALRRGRIAGTGNGEPYLADLGINFANGGKLHDEQLAGASIVDLGDLAVHGAETEIDCDGCEVTPAGFHWCPNVTPLNLPSGEQIDQAIMAGAATIIGIIDATNPEQADALQDIRKEQSAVHLVFVEQGQIDGEKLNIPSDATAGEFARSVDLASDTLGFSVRAGGPMLGRKADIAVWKTEANGRQLHTLLIDGHVAWPHREIALPGRLLRTGFDSSAAR